MFVSFDNVVSLNSRITIDDPFLLSGLAALKYVVDVRPIIRIIFSNKKTKNPVSRNCFAILDNILNYHLAGKQIEKV
jgi:hypothetical protein